MVVCCDSDHDSMPEMMFNTGTIQPRNPLRIEVWEHRGWNRFGLVFTDTGEYPEPPGITTGNALPFAAGDVDGDRLVDVVCISKEEMEDGLFYNVVMTLESPDSFSYPCSLSWYYRYGNNMPFPIPTYYPPDLDGDGRKEIVVTGWIWENSGDNQNDSVWYDRASALTFGDFDLDGRMNFATSRGILTVWECMGDDQYEVVYEDTAPGSNGYDAFMTNDIDEDGLPEFYVAYHNVPEHWMYLYMWEADQIGSDVYHRTLADSVRFLGINSGCVSECGDIDGDGIDECIWTKPDGISMYKAFGDDDLRTVWSWYSDHGEERSLVSKVYDVNGDGYNELITAGNRKISVFEVDAIDLVSPQYGTYGVGDRIPIRWATHSPPRCDSVSLLLRVDSLWHCQTIATGIPGTDTLYRWVVPEDVADTGRIVVIAYGPGWQYDVSDSVITFIGGGVAEGTGNVPLQWSLSVSPNPTRGAFTVRYDVPGKWGQSQPLRGQTEVQSPFSTVPVFALGIYDAGGRLVRSLTNGDVSPGRYEARLSSGTLPAGVYFVRLEPSAVSRQPLAVTKVVVTR